MKTRKSQFPSMIGIMTGLVIILIFIFGSIAALDNNESNQSMENISVPEEINRTQAVQNCMDANGFVTNMTGVDNQTIYEVCKWK